MAVQAVLCAHVEKRVHVRHFKLKNITLGVHLKSASKYQLPWT